MGRVDPSRGVRALSPTFQCDDGVVFVFHLKNSLSCLPLLGPRDPFLAPHSGPTDAIVLWSGRVTAKHDLLDADAFSGPENAANVERGPEVLQHNETGIVSELRPAIRSFVRGRKLSSVILVFECVRSTGTIRDHKSMRSMSSLMCLSRPAR